MNETIQVERSGAFVRLILNRPQVRNALDSRLIQELTRALDALEDDPAVRVVVLTGAGSAFSAGADLKELKEIIDQPVDRNLDDSRQLKELFQRLYAFPKPTIAAVNGPAIAGGCGLVLVCDLAVASEEARFGFTEVRIGFVPALVGVLLVQTCGPRKARELLVTGRVIDASEAQALGLVNSVVPATRLSATCRKLAVEVAENAPGAVRRIRELLDAVSHLPPEEALELAFRFNALSRTDPELKEGIAAYLEKRPPSWRKQG